MSYENTSRPLPLQDQNLSNRFLFNEVVEDITIQQDILSIALGKETAVC